MPNNISILDAMNLSNAMNVNPHSKVLTYSDLKHMVELGATKRLIMECAPIGIAEHIIDDLIERAKHEIYVESNIFPSEAGKLLYDANS